MIFLVAAKFNDQVVWIFAVINWIEIVFNWTCAKKFFILLQNTNGSGNEKFLMNKHASTNGFMLHFIENSSKYKRIGAICTLAICLERESILSSDLLDLLYLSVANRSNCVLSVSTATAKLHTRHTNRSVRRNNIREMRWNVEDIINLDDLLFYHNTTREEKS